MRKIAVAMAAGAAALSAVFGSERQVALADDFPTRPIQIVSGRPPGGPTDFVGRIVADKMRDALGQAVIIDNGPGANGTLAANSSPNPSCRRLYAVSHHIRRGDGVAAYHARPGDFEPLRSAAPVALVSKATEVLVVTPRSGIKTVKDLVALAKEKPGAVAFASSGLGSPPQLAEVQLAASAGVKFLYVPYKGAAPAFNELLAGQVAVMAADAPVVLPQVKAGSLVAIGAAAPARDAILPDVPTLTEQGYPDIDATNWLGLLAPAKTPPAVVAKINSAVNAALNDAVTRDRLVQSGATPLGGTADSFGTFMKAEYERWGRVIKERGITTTQEVIISGGA